MTESVNSGFEPTHISIPRKSSLRKGNIPSNPPKEQHNDMELDEEEFEFFHEFEREKVKTVIHLITIALKDKAADVEFLMIPFRPQQTNEGLLQFLNAMFPLGNGQPVAEAKQKKLVSNTEVHTLFQGLKYIWCRLQDGEVVGWKPYLQFKVREKSQNYPRKAFLELMPPCLESPSHASIVYDFFDLIVSISANSRINKMSARKISKMFAIWAFEKQVPDPSVADYNFDEKRTLPNNSFQDGLDQWLPATDAMFHLLLAFLKSFVPEDLETAQLPRTLKSLLFNNEYPPEKSTVYTSETILTIPLVTLATDKFSRKPWELLERCNDKLDFSNYEGFEAREDYALLKSLFKKKNNVEGISRKMSQESRRLMKEMSTKHSTFQAGWAPRKCVPNYDNLPEDITVKRVDIDDYFIWTWLSSLSYEQTSERKKIFGRSLILEFQFDGFKKWVLFQESDVVLAQQKRGPKNSRENNDSRVSSNASSKDSNEKPLAKVPKTRNVTPSYEKFQKQVAQEPPEQSDDFNEAYHTVISRETLDKNNGKHNVNLHLLEQKISSFWNPLHKSKKKNKSPSHSSSEIREITNIAALPRDDHQKNQEKTIPEDARKGAPNTPPKSVEDTLEPNKAVPALRNHENTTPDETLKELKGIVDDMMAEDSGFENGSTAINSEKETFETLTKFDQYKPSALSDTGGGHSVASATSSLRVPSEGDGKRSPSVGPISHPSESSSYYETPTSAHTAGDFYKQRHYPITPHAKTSDASAGGSAAAKSDNQPHSMPPSGRQPAAKPFKQSPTPHGPQQYGNKMLYYQTPRSDPQLASDRTIAHIGGSGGVDQTGYAAGPSPPMKELPRSGYSQPALQQYTRDTSQAMLNLYKPNSADPSPRAYAGSVPPLGAPDHQDAAYPGALSQARNSYPVVPQVVPQATAYPGPPQITSLGMPSPQMRQQRSPHMPQQQKMSPQMGYGFGYPGHNYGRPQGNAPGPPMQPMQPMQQMQQMQQMQPMQPMYGVPPMQGMLPAGHMAKSPSMQGPMPGPMPGVPNLYAQPGARLHGATNKRQERKRLHNNIRNGNFGI